MKLGVLFSGGKDSTYACYLEKKKGNEICCLVSLFSENPDSFMFHTPAIEFTKKQAELMKIPLLTEKTKGKKEEELADLKRAIKMAIEKYKIEGIVTGALASVYQAERIQKICDELKIKCVNPLWQKNQIGLLNELLENNFEVLISAVAAYPLEKIFVGRKIDKKFIKEVEVLAQKYKINPAGEGGEFESLVINCPLFEKKLEIKLRDVVGEKNSFRGNFVFL
jgi:asparagine synthase (glutamine-hydrolysing)